MTCPKCGNVQLLSVACTRCGTAMDADPSPSPVLRPGFDPGPYLGTGELLGKAFSLYFKNLPLFLGLTIVAFSPLLLVYVGRLYVHDTPLFANITGLDYLTILVRSLCGPFAVALVTDGVLRHLRDEGASLGGCLRTGFGALFPVLGVAVLYMLAMALGYALCVLPAVYVMVVYAVAVPALLVERIGPASAMRRSVQLTGNYRWPLFGALFVIGCIDAVLDLFVTFVLERPAGGEKDIHRLIQNILGLFPEGLFAITCVLAYHRLRGIKESFGLAETVSVFD